MPFGLCNSPATFQRLMNRCMHNIEHCLIYLDDIISFDSVHENHLKNLENIFRRLKEFGLKLNPAKCQFLKSKVKYLGHVVSSQGVEIDPDEVLDLKNMSAPTSIDELQRFLGFVGFHRRFIKDLSKVAKPLTDMLRGQNCTRKRRGRLKAQIPFCWGEVQQNAFDTLIYLCTTTPVLGYADYTLPFLLHVDASTKGLGAVLCQEQSGGRRVIAYASRGLTESESKYPIHKLEFLSLKWAMTEKFYDYLYGHKVQVWTDNNPLTYVLTSAKLDATGHRWLAALSAFDFSISYKPGKGNCDADMLSRLPRTEASEDVVKAIMQLEHQEAYIHSLSCDPSVTDVLGEIPIVNTVDIVKLQQEDSVLSKVIPLVEMQEKPSNDELKMYDKDVVLLLRQWDKLFIDDGVLYRKAQIDGSDVQQQVVPNQCRSQILHSLHDDMGHVGRDRTEDLLRTRFYWPGMFTDVESYVKNCIRCTCRKVPGDKAPLVSMTSTHPMELVCIDFLTVEPSKGYENILVITDHFSKFSQAYPTKNQLAKTTAHVLFEHYIVHYGVPARIHSDQVRNFESKVIKELCNIMSIQKSRTTPYHAMGNGLVERFNRSLLQMLGTLEADKKKNWKDYLPSVVHAYNCTKHVSTGFSPYKLMFGRDPKLPVDLEYGLVSHSDPHEHDYSSFVDSLNKQLEYAWNLASENQSISASKQKLRYDLKHHGASLQIGDRVLIQNVGLKGRSKLADKWQDVAYVVKGQSNPDIPVFKVSPEGGGKEKVLHRNLLLPISHVNENVNPKSKGQKITPKPRISLPVPPVESECSSSDESFDDAIIEVVVPQLGPEVL